MPEVSKREDQAKRVAAIERAAYDMRAGKTSLAYVREFALYCWALDDAATNDANARAVATALAADTTLVIDDVVARRCWLIKGGKS